jgi:virginiamycin B lyase
MSFTIVMLLAGSAAPDTAMRQLAGRVIVPRDAGAQPILVITRDSSRGITRSVTATNGRFTIPARAGAVVSALTLDGRWAADLVGGSDSPTLDLKPAGASRRRPSSAAWIAKLPDTETRRRFILDCTGCHQFDETRATKAGAARTAATWSDDLARMLRYAGPHSNFPVISSWAQGAEVAGWLAAGVAGGSPPPAQSVPLTEAIVTEFDFPVAGDLPHDLAVDSAGSIVVTGMFSHAMFVLDPATAVFQRVEIPVDNANPRAVELDRVGDWWVLLGGPAKVGRYDVRRRDWKFFDIGIYPHSITVAGTGRVWYNGHFTRDPEQIGVIDPASGAVTVHHLPIHPTMGQLPGGPIPYEQREGPDGRIWVSELQGNRLIEFDPKTGRSRAHTLPTSWSGPRRFDVDRQGILWIPGYGANLLVSLDPATGRFTEHRLPIPGATPYIVRVDRSGAVWIGTSAADAAFRFDPKTSGFTMIPLPSQGALVRHLTIDPRTGDVWLAYGASPARIPARIARIQLRAGS